MTRNTFPSQNIQNRPFSDHFWKLRCRKNIRRCSANHISKSKCTKHLSIGRFLEIKMSKKYTPLQYEVYLEINMHKVPHVHTIFRGRDIDKVHAIIAQNIFRNQNIKTTKVRTTFRGPNIDSLRFTIMYYIILHYTPLHTITLTLHSTTLQL